MKRLHSIDAVRGLVMIIMALDHTRDLIHVTALTQNPTDLSTTTPILFFTRWITHLCAPIFVFLSGTSVYLSLQRNGFQSTRNFLATRGFWLILLEFTIVNFALLFDLKFRTNLFEVIATIGFGFIVLALILRALPNTIGVTGLAIIFLHGLFTMLVIFRFKSAISPILAPLFIPSPYLLSPERMLSIAYPPIPWLGIMLAGFGAGQVFTMESARRKTLLLRVGAISLGLFIALRFANVYGDFPWKSQEGTLFTFLAFVNVSKYPPSLLFILSMLGIMFLLLGLFEGKENAALHVLGRYGKVPLFYFIVHLYLIHSIMLFMMFYQGFAWQDLNFGIFGFGRPKGESGVSLGAIYFIWICVVIALYPACTWYAAYKEKHKDNLLLRYL